MTKKQCIVTGAAGFLGSHLCEHLLDSDFDVIGVDNLSTSSGENFKYLQSLEKSSHFEAVEADVTQEWHWAPGDNTNVEHIFHFASPASPPLYQALMLETMAVNSTALLRALEYSLSSSAKVLFASTSEIYGDPEISPQPEDYRGNVNTVGPRSCYDESKRFGESLIWSFNKKHGTKHQICRIFNTYGPRMNPQDGRVVINFLVQALRNEELSIYGNGKQTRSFCYVDDLIQGILKLAMSERLGPLNIGNPQEFSILELAETVCQITGIEKKFKFHDLPADDPQQRRPDLSRIKKELNWEPKIKLEEGLKRMKAWLEARN